jgi:hypothetical protein
MGGALVRQVMADFNASRVLIVLKRRPLHGLATLPPAAFDPGSVKSGRPPSGIARLDQPRTGKLGRFPAIPAMAQLGVGGPLFL